MCADLGLVPVVSACTGMAVFPDEGESAEDLLAIANRRMHLSKRAHHASLQADATECAVAA